MRSIPQRAKMTHRTCKGRRFRPRWPVAAPAAAPAVTPMAKRTPRLVLESPKACWTEARAAFHEPQNAPKVTKANVMIQGVDLRREIRTVRRFREAMGLRYRACRTLFSLPTLRNASSKQPPVTVVNGQKSSSKTEPTSGHRSMTAELKNWALGVAVVPVFEYLLARRWVSHTLQIFLRRHCSMRLPPQRRSQPAAKVQPVRST